MAVNRETIEIQLAGADRVRNLTRDLNAAQAAAASLSDQLEETAERLEALGTEQRTFNANTRATGGQRRLVRGAQQNPGFTAGLSRAEAATIRDDLRERAASIAAQLRGRALEGRALRQKIRSVTQQQKAEQARLEEVKAQQKRLIRVQDKQIGLIENNNQFLRRELGVSRRRSRERTTGTRRARYEQTISRIGGEQNLGATSRQRIGELRQVEARVSQQLNTLDEAAAASRRATLVQRESLAERRFRERSGFASELQDLRAGLRAGGSRAAFVTGRLGVRQRVQESESNFAQTAARITQESNANERAFEAARRSLTTELGSIAEGIREVLRTDKGIKAGDTRQRRLFERAAELERAGATQGPAIGTGRGARVISPSTLVDVRSRLNRASGFFAQGDVESANRLLDSAEKTLSTAERDLNTRKKITRENEAQSKSAVSLNKQREKALDTENDRAIKLQRLQGSINELRAGGARGFGLQRAEALAGRLPGLEQAGNLPEFDRILKQALDAVTATKSSLTKQARSTKAISQFQKGITKIEEKVAQGKQVTLDEASRLQAFNESQRRQRGFGPGGPGAGGGVPAQLALPAGDPSLPRFRGGARPAGEGVIGRTAEEAAKALAGAQSDLITKSAKPVAQKFVEAFAAEATSSVVGRNAFKGLGDIAKAVTSPAAIRQNIKGVGPAVLDPAEAQSRLNKALNSGRALTAQLNILSAAGVDTTEQQKNLQNALNDANRKDFDLNRQSLGLLESQLGVVRSFVGAEKSIGAEAKDRLKRAKDITRENERQSKDAVALASQKEAALNSETDRTIKLQGLQRKLNELRAAGATGPGMQSAQTLIGRLPDLEQAGNFAQFDRDAKRASNALLDVASASRLQTKASKDVTTAENRRTAATRKGEDLEFKLRELTTAGVDPRQLAASVGGKPAQLQKILGRAFSEASFGDPGKAAELLDIVGRRITILQRELGLNKKIASEEEKRLNAAKQGFPSSPVRGSKEIPGSPAWQAQNFDKPDVGQMRLNKALSSGDVLLKKLETLRMKGVDTVQEELNLQNTLNTARNSGFQLSKNNLNALENSIKSAELFVSAEQKLTTELEKQFKLRKMAAGGSGPIRRDTLTGKVAGFSDLGIAGRVQLGGRGTDSAVNQIVQAFNRSVGAQGGKAGQQLGLKDLAKVSRASARELELLTETLSMVRAGMRSTDKGFDQIGDTIARVNRQIERQDPDADFLTRRLGVRGGRAASEGLIGGAFPLLFGQGVGAAAGGALGGGLGGFAGGMLGFGLSLAGTAIGSAIDGVMQAAQDTGEMLRDLTGNFDQIKEAGLLASREQERLVQSLLDAGNKTAAYSIIQTELNNKLGADGVSKLRAAADAGERMQRAMAELGKQIEIFVAGPLADFLNRIAGFIERANIENQVSAALAAAPADARALAQAQLSAAQRAQGQQNQALPFGQRVGAELASRLGVFNPFGAPDKATYGLPRFGDLPQDALQNVLGGLRAATPPAPQTDEEKRSAAVKEAETSLANAQRDLQVASRQLESVDLFKGFQQQLIAVRREQEDIDRQSFEIRRDYERQIADIRENVENKVLQINQDNRRKEIEIIGKQGELRQAQIRLLGLELQGALAGDELAAGLADAVTTYLSAQLSAQDQIEQRRLQFELEISNQQIEVEKFKTDIAKNVSQLNLSTAERIESINFGIARRNEDAARNNFETEKKIAGLKISASKRELFLEKNNINTQLVLARANASLQPQNEIAQVLVTTLEGQVKEIDKAMSEIEDLRKRIEASPAPQPIRSVAPLGAKGVSTAGIDAAASQNRRLLGQARDLLDAITRVNQGGDLQQFFNTLDNLVLGSSQRLESEFKASWDELRITLGETGIAAERLDNSFDKFFADFEARNEALRKAGKPSEQLSESQKALINGYREVAKELAELEQTQRFYTESQRSLNERYTQARDGIKELLGPTTEYEKLLKRFETSGGLGVDTEKRQELLDAARAVDTLNEELRALNALNELAGGLTDSFIQFNKELLTGKSLAKSLTQFLQSAADRSIDVFLEYTLRPIQEKMFKDLAKFLGFDMKEDPALRELKFIGGEATAIRSAVEKLDGLKDALRPATPVPAPAPANGIVPGPGAIPHSRQFDTIRTPSGDEPTNKSHTDYPQYGQWVGSPQSSIRGFSGVGGPDLLGSSLLNQIQSEGGFEDTADLRPLPVQRMLQQIGRPFTQIYKRIESSAKTAFPYTRQEAKKMLAPNPVRTQQVLQRAQKVEQVRQNWNPIDAQWQERTNRLNPAPRSAPARAELKAFEGVVKHIEDKVFNRALGTGQGLGGIRDLSDFLTTGEQQVLRKGVQQQLRAGKTPFQIEFSASSGVREFIRKTIEEQMPPGSYKAIRPAPTIDPLRNKRDPWVERYMQQTEPPRIIPGVENQFEGAFLPGQSFDISRLGKLFGLTASADGIGGPDLPLAIERVPGIRQKDIERALEFYRKTEDQFTKRLGEMRTVAEVENYKSDILGIITQPSFPAGFSADQAGPIRTDMAATLDRLTIERLSELAAKAQTAGAAIDKVTASANGAAKGLGEVAGSGAAAAETQAAAANKTESTVEQQNQSLRKFGQVAGASIQTLSGVAMAVGGAQMIGKGGAYNTLMGIAGIFGGISSVASGIGGFSKAFGGSTAAQPEGFAKGGRPDPFDPIYVGENGMELWVPDRPGTIISNDNLDNVYIPGLDDEDGTPLQVGRYSGRSAGGPSESTWDGDSQATPYTRSRVSQGRPQSSGGSYGRSVPYQRSETTREIDRLERVAANPRELPPIKYETQRVNTYDFVTPQQLEESNARTAKTARAQTIRELTDSLKTRKRIGL